MFEMYKKVIIENYTNFNGRARRKEYWKFILAHLIISFIIGFIVGVIQKLTSSNLTIVGNIYSLAILTPGIAVSIRRMHDLDKSGWFILIPIYNIVLLATEGTSGSNQYGLDPKNESDEISQVGKE